MLLAPKRNAFIFCAPSSTKWPRKGFGVKARIDTCHSGLQKTSYSVIPNLSNDDFSDVSHLQVPHTNDKSPPHRYPNNLAHLSSALKPQKPTLPIKSSIQA
jgi:hypothetical protein